MIKKGAYTFKYIALKLKVKIVEGEEISNTFIA